MYVAEMWNISIYCIQVWCHVHCTHHISTNKPYLNFCLPVCTYVYRQGICMNFSREIGFTDFDFHLCTDLTKNKPKFFRQTIFHKFKLNKLSKQLRFFSEGSEVSEDFLKITYLRNPHKSHITFLMFFWFLICLRVKCWNVLFISFCYLEILPKLMTAGIVFTQRLSPPWTVANLGLNQLVRSFGKRALVGKARSPPYTNICTSESLAWLTLKTPIAWNYY